MKKFLLLIAVITFIGSAASAQFSIGGKLGGATTNITGTGLESFVPESKIKILAGAVANYSIGKRFALQAELLYQGKGAAFSYYKDIDDEKYLISMENKLGYLSVPFMLQFKLGDRYNYFHLDAGIVTNSLLHSKYSGTIQLLEADGTFSDKKAYLLDQSVDSFDLGYAFGIGLVANGLNFDFRMEIGTDKIYKNVDDTTPEIYNNSFQVSVGYTFSY